MRTRTKTASGKFGYNGGAQYLNGAVVSEVISDQARGPGPCVHHKYSLYTGSCGTGPSTTLHTATNMPCENWAVGATEAVLARTHKLANDLEWSKLPTSNQFGLLQFLAELDDSLAIFTKKFIERLSYGSVTWGVLPFLSDIEALLLQIERLVSGIDFSQSAYCSTQTLGESFKYRANGIEWTVNFRAVQRNMGFVALPGSFRDLSTLYDLLGFRPSLATAFDLIPFSFVLNWVSGVGDFLENLRVSEGWTAQVYFKGWSSTKIDWTVSNGVVLPEHGWVVNPPCVWQNVSYLRSFGDRILNDLEFKPSVEWVKLPSIKNVFNMFYLAFSPMVVNDLGTPTKKPLTKRLKHLRRALRSHI